MKTTLNLATALLCSVLIGCAGGETESKPVSPPPPTAESNPAKNQPAAAATTPPAAGASDERDINTIK